MWPGPALCRLIARTPSSSVGIAGWDSRVIDENAFASRKPSTLTVPEVVTVTGSRGES